MSVLTPWLLTAMETGSFTALNEPGNKKTRRTSRRVRMDAVSIFFNQGRLHRLPVSLSGLQLWKILPSGLPPVF